MPRSNNRRYAPGVVEGVLEWEGLETWYRVDGDLDAELAPLVILHGGPGAAHDYLEPLAALTPTTGRPCVLYDQIGCGRSQHLPDAHPGFWTVDLFKRELATLLDHLDIGGAYHLLGQSWGGMLAMEHAVDQPNGLRSMVIANSPASLDLWVSEARRLRAKLDRSDRDALDRHEAVGSTDSDEYREAVMRYYERHLCRIPFPDCLQRTFDQLTADPTVYHTMNGPSEFHVIGSLKGWDVTPRLGEVKVPVLVISGEHDEATPGVVEPLVRALPDARWELIEDASHSTHLEQPELFLSLVEGFLEAHD